MKLFLDACAIIYWLEAQPPFHDKFVQVLRDLRTQHEACGLAVSRLSVLECLVEPLRASNETLLRDYRDFFARRDLTVIDIDASLLEAAARLRAEYHLATPDALQAACALALADETLFITNDIRFDRVSGLHIHLL